MTEMPKYHPDQADVVDDAFLSAFLDYLGFPVLRCSAQHRGSIVWSHLIPSCDFEIMQEEFSNPETNIFIKPYTASLKKVFAFQGLARKSGGEHVDPAWRDAIRRTR